MLTCLIFTSFFYERQFLMKWNFSARISKSYLMQQFGLGSLFKNVKNQKNWIWELPREINQNKHCNLTEKFKLAEFDIFLVKIIWLLSKIKTNIAIWREKSKYGILTSNWTHWSLKNHVKLIRRQNSALIRKHFPWLTIS